MPGQPEEDGAERPAMPERPEARRKRAVPEQPVEPEPPAAPGRSAKPAPRADSARPAASGRPADIRQARESAKIRSHRDQRVTYDLPPALRKRIQALAAEQRLPASQLVTLALLRFLRDYESGAAPLVEYRQPSRSHRYAWNLVYPPELLALLDKRKKG